MAANTGLRVEGMDRLKRTLKEAGRDLRELKDTNAEVGALVAGRGVPAMPVLTGRLAGSVRSSGTNRAAVIRAGGASIPYAGVQEFGWPARNIPAQPALTDALAQSEDDILRMYQEAADQALAQVKGA